MLPYMSVVFRIVGSCGCWLWLASYPRFALGLVCWRQGFIWLLIMPYNTHLPTRMSGTMRLNEGIT